MAAHEADLPDEKLSKALNAVIRRLAELGYFEPRLRTITDTTDEEVPPSFEGAGKVRKKVKVDTKARRPKKVNVTLLGFKVWYLMDVKTGIPLAFAFDTIERPDNEHAKALVFQAIENLKGYSTIVSLALDRGFMDGDLLWWLKEEKGIDWVCPSKERMAVTDEARSNVWGALLAASPKFPEFKDLPPAQRGLAVARRLAQTQQESQGVRFAERKIDDKRGERLGVLRYHRQESVNMRHKVIIAMDDRYGILHLREFAKLAGLPVLDARPTGVKMEPHSE